MACPLTRKSEKAGSYTLLGWWWADSVAALAMCR
jgi:hypothetical protein